ncbi:MAG: Uma2 family endonuclease [Pirellulales bacterium]|nr:Uma2 family endonuclease [Pirellulales bacterium]
MSTDLHITVAQYEQMIAEGVFVPSEEHRVELIRGEIREMSPIHPPHEDALDRLAEWSFDSAPRMQVRVRVQLSIELLGLQSIPQPDLAWVRRGDYSRQRPTSDEVLLVVEVADTSVRFDRGEKAALYAEAGIADYWIVDVNRRTIEVCREPSDGVYRRREIVDLAGAVGPSAFPHLSLKLADLFPAASEQHR